MLKIVLVGIDAETRQFFQQTLSEKGISEIVHLEYGKEVLEAQGPQNIALLIIAEDLPDLNPIDLIKEIVSINPFQNIAMVSDQAPDQFHEMTEGLGVLGQITTRNRLETLDTVLDRVNQTFQLSNS